MVIYIIEDGKEKSETLINAINKIDEQIEIESFSDSDKLLLKLKERKADVVFVGVDAINLSKKIQEIAGKINIVIVADDVTYTASAFELFVSGYILRPVNEEKIKAQLNNLRYAVENKKITIRTFGNFTMFYGGKPIKFARSKTQMMIAYLVYKRGTAVNRKEISSTLFEEGFYTSNRQSYMSKICADAKSILKKLGIEKFLIESSSDLAIDTSMCQCDYYDYLNGNSGAKRLYNGEFMEQYSFGEDVKIYLDSDTYKDDEE